MMETTTILTAALSAALGLTAACSGGANTAANVNKTTMNADTAVVVNSGETKSADDIPASVKTAFPDAQSFTKQHKDIPKDAIADIEKDTGAKVPDTDHHSYLAFATKDGKRTQIGAATLVNFKPKNSYGSDDQLVVIYKSKNGQPIIKKVIYETAVSGNRESRIEDFVKQFAGKRHDDKLKLGDDLKINTDNDLGEAIAQAVRIDLLTMQNLYGTAHAH